MSVAGSDCGDGTSIAGGVELGHGGFGEEAAVGNLPFVVGVVQHGPDQVRHDLGMAKPEIAVTTTETEHVAECLRDGVAYRIHAPGGSIVLNPDGPLPVPGQNGYAGRDDEVEPARPARWHRQELEHRVAAQDQRRTETNAWSAPAGTS